MSDLISRQAAIDALRYAQHRFTVADEAGGMGTVKWREDVIYFAAAERVLTELPSVQPESRREWYMHGYRDAQPRWIPVTERLPEDGVTVWVTIKGHDVIRCEEGETLEQAIARISKIRWVTQGYWSDEEHGWNDPSFGCPLMVKPIAWMPMEVPEPYKEGEK